MPDFEVEYGGPLDTRLARAGIPIWRVPILIANNVVKVFRDGTEIPVTKPDMKVRGGDTLRLPDPLPPDVIKALQAAADTSASDYAFVPGARVEKPSAFDLRMADVVDHRPRTVHLKTQTSLRQYIAAFGKGDELTKPIRHIMIASHATAEGFLFMKLDMFDPADISYEDLEAAVKSKSLLINPDWLEPRPRDSSQTAIPAQFLVRGCRIGMPFKKLPDNYPFLTKLKEALGNKIPVVAPRHFHIAGQHSNPDGFTEFMGYGFRLSRPKPFLKNKDPDRAGLVKAFQTGGFERIDNKPVPPELWDGWIPTNPHAQEEQELDAKVVDPVINKPLTTKFKFKFKHRWLFGEKKEDREKSIPLETDPGDEAGQKAALQADLEKNDPRFQSTHPFPAYARLGYDSITEFMDGFTWNFRFDSKKLYFSPRRAEYTTKPPITEIATNKLILNFYPAKAKDKPLELLDIANKDFFTTV
jgi:hypothetical protein